jgi:hypothetical protein
VLTPPEKEVLSRSLVISLTCVSDKQNDNWARMGRSCKRLCAVCVGATWWRETEMVIVFRWNWCDGGGRQPIEKKG